MKLFSVGFYINYLNNKKKNIEREINKLNDDMFLNENIKETLSEIKQKYQSKQISIDFDGLYGTKENKTERDLIRDTDKYMSFREVDIEKIIVTYNFPIISGENELQYIPSSSVDIKFYNEIRLDEKHNRYNLVLIVKKPISELEKLIDNDENDKVDDLFKNDLNLKIDIIKQMIGSLNNEIEIGNSEISNLVNELAEKRIEKSKKVNALLNRISIPVKPKFENIQDNGKVPLIIDVKNPPINKVSDLPKPINTELYYTIQDSDYRKIIKSIRSFLYETENYSSTFQSIKNEEFLRDILISHLTATFDLKFSGETFNKNGKTDIFVNLYNKACFIAECKIWSGDKKLQEAIEQLYGYATWKEEKTAIIIYNYGIPKRDTLHSKIKESIIKNDNFIKIVGEQENMIECEFQSINNNASMIITFIHSSYK